MTFIATVTSKNQLTIPIDIARYFKISKGSRLKIKAYHDKIEIIPVINGLDDCLGMLSDNPIAKKYANLSWNQLKKTPEWRQAEYEEAKRIANKK